MATPPVFTVPLVVAHDQQSGVSSLDDRYLPQESDYLLRPLGQNFLFVRAPGPGGNDLLSVNQYLRTVVVGNAKGVFIGSTFRLHEALLVGSGNVWEFPIPGFRFFPLDFVPLQVQLAPLNAYLLVRGRNALRVFFLTQAKGSTGGEERRLSAGLVVEGRFSGASISRRNMLGAVDEESKEFRIWRDLHEGVQHGEHIIVYSLKKTESFAFSPKGGRIALGSAEEDGLVTVTNTRLIPLFVMDLRVQASITQIHYHMNSEMIVELNKKKGGTPLLAGLHFLYQQRAEMTAKDLTSVLPRRRGKIGSACALAAGLADWRLVVLAATDCSRVGFAEDFSDGFYSIVQEHPDLEIPFSADSGCHGMAFDPTMMVPLPGEPKELVSPVLLLLDAFGYLTAVHVTYAEGVPKPYPSMLMGVDYSDRTREIYAAQTTKMTKLMDGQSPYRKRGDWIFPEQRHLVKEELERVSFLVPSFATARLLIGVDGSATKLPLNAMRSLFLT